MTAKTTSKQATNQTASGLKAKRKATGKAQAKHHEREAQVAADRVLRGDLNVAQHLTSAPSARRLSATSGSLLPAYLRQTLERSFGADLSAIRLHTGAHAHLLTTEYGAHAMTSGRDIFFRAGAFQPMLPSGKHLIAHEVAHAIQQTRVSNSAGEVTVSERYGDADVQRADDEDDTFQPTFKEFRDRYRALGRRTATTSEQTELSRIIAIAEAAVGSVNAKLNQSLGEREDVKTLAANVRAGVHSSVQNIALTFLYDFLKLVEHYRAAVHLVTENPDIETHYYGPRNYFVYLNSLGDQWLLPMFTHISEIKDVYPGGYLGAIWRYFTRPSSSPSASFQVATAIRKHKAYRKTLKGAMFLPNERKELAWNLLERLNQILRTDLKTLERDFGIYSPAERRKRAASFYKSHVQEYATNSDLESQKQLVPAIVSRLDAIIEFWKQATDLREQMGRSVTSFNDKHLTKLEDDTAEQIGLPTLPDAVRADRHFMTFLRSIKTQILKLLGGDDLTVLGPDEYKDAILSFQEKIPQQRKIISSRIDSLYKQWQRNDADRKKIVIWYGWAQLYLDILEQHLGLYDYDKDKLTMTRYQGLQDVRMVHRERSALFGQHIALLLNDNPMLEQLNKVLTAQDIGRSYLAIAGDWIQSNNDLDQLEKDFEDNNPIKGWGVTPRILSKFFKLLKITIENEQLGMMLRVYEENPDPSSLNLASKAFENTKRIYTAPERWVPDDYVVVWNENDANVEERSDIGNLITHHPRFPELRDKVKANFHNSLVQSGKRSYEAFVWFFPSFDRIVRYLRNSPALRELLKSDGVDLSTTSSDEFIPKFIEIAEFHLTNPDFASLAGDFNTFEQTIEGEIGADITRQQLKQYGLLRRATTHDRRVIERVLRAHLNAYAEAPNVTNLVKMYEVIDLIYDFKGHIAPRHRDNPRYDDLEEQFSALILSLAPDISKALHRDAPFFFAGNITEDSYSLVTEFYNFISEAIAFSQHRNSVARLKIVSHSTEDAKKLDQNALTLMMLKHHLDAQIEKIQRKVGFQTNSDHTALRQTGETNIFGAISGDDDTGFRTLAPNSPFTIDGKNYVILEIYTDFLYHPPYGLGTAAETDPILTDLQGRKINPDTPLLKYWHNEMTEADLTPQAEGDVSERGVVVKAKDDEHLRLLQDAVSRALIMQGLGALADAIRKGTEITAEIVATLIPGGQLALTIAQLVKFVAQDLPKLKANLLDNPQAIVDEIGKFVSPENRDRAIEQLWLFLLGDGNLPFESQLNALSESDDNSRRARTRIQKIVRFAKSVGGEVLDSFLDFRYASQGSMVSARRILVQYPMLQYVVSTIPTLMAISATIDRDSARDLTELLGNIVNDPSQLSKKFEEVIAELMKGLTELTLPEEIIPMDLIVEVVLDRFVRSLGYKGRIIAELSDALGLTSEISTAVADALKSHGADPNLLWQATMRDHLNALLDDAKIEIIGGINRISRNFFGDGFLVINVGAMPQIRAQFEANTPALEGLRRSLDEDDESDMDILYPVRIDPRRGKPFRPSQREYYEQAFGHDFSHVRIHDDEHAAQLNAYYKTIALTSGSHIFLADDLYANSARADAILRHELAHVLQQTGSRPLELDSDDTPVLGQPRRGLVINHRRELAAQLMAHRSQYPITDNALPVEEEGGFGLMPAGANVVASVIDNLAQGNAVDDLVERIDNRQTVPATISRHKGFVGAANEATKIWNEVRDKLGKTTAEEPSDKHSKPFNTADEGSYEGGRNAIATFFRGSSASSKLSSKQIRALTSYSVKTVRDKYELKPNAFIASMVNYVFGKTGISLNVGYNEATNKVTYARIDAIDLGLINASTNIYSTMKKNTNTYLQTRSITFEDRDWRKIRSIMKAGAFDSAVWDKDVFRLSDAIITELDEIMKNIGDASVGTWDEYKNTTAVSPKGSLRVATHGELTGGGARAGRQSHHLPQYLLVEYFRDKNATHLRKGSNNLFLPGFQGGANSINSFVGVKTIDFTLLDPNAGRGDGIPAISLSARTHQRGRLHLNAAYKWDDKVEYDGKGTQGATLDSYFFKRFKHHSGISETDATKLVEEARKDSNRYKSDVYSAIKDTYRWMYGMMLTALKHALPQEEIDYYKIVAKQQQESITGSVNSGNEISDNQLKPDYRPKKSDLDAVIAAIEGKNNEKMQNWK